MKSKNIDILWSGKKYVRPSRRFFNKKFSVLCSQRLACMFVIENQKVSVFDLKHRNFHNRNWKSEDIKAIKKAGINNEVQLILFNPHKFGNFTHLSYFSWFNSVFITIPIWTFSMCLMNSTIVAKNFQNFQTDHAHFSLPLDEIFVFSSSRRLYTAEVRLNSFQSSHRHWTLLSQQRQNLDIFRWIFEYLNPF